MTNSEMLREAIDRSGLKIGFIAGEMGVSRPTLYKRIANPDKLTGAQAKVLSRLLRLSESDRNKIFW